MGDWQDDVFDQGEGYRRRVGQDRERTLHTAGVIRSKGTAVVRALASDAEARVSRANARFPNFQPPKFQYQYVPSNKFFVRTPYYPMESVEVWLEAEARCIWFKRSKRRDAQSLCQEALESFGLEVC